MGIALGLGAIEGGGGGRLHVLHDRAGFLFGYGTGTMRAFGVDGEGKALPTRVGYK